MTMARRLVLPLVCACVCVCTGSFSSSLSGDDQLTVMQHYRRVRSFKCSVPRPTSVPVTSLLQPHGSSAVYLPPVTVLHRCDAGAGCCLAPGHSCTVLDSRPVNLTFHVTQVAGHARGYVRLLTLTAHNHTRCGCVREDEEPPR